jgi:hypothetical protein
VVLLTTVILLGVYNVYNSIQIGTNVQEYRDKIDSIQTEIDSVALLNTQLDNKLTQIDTNVVQITKEITVVDNTINIIKTQTDDKISNVDKFNHNKLQQFFTDRYK